MITLELMKNMQTSLKGKGRLDFIRCRLFFLELKRLKSATTDTLMQAETSKHFRKGDKIMTTQELMEYKDYCGAESAYNLLLLGGPDYFDGDYDKILDKLEKEMGK